MMLHDIAVQHRDEINLMAKQMHMQELEIQWLRQQVVGLMQKLTFNEGKR